MKHYYLSKEQIKESAREALRARDWDKLEKIFQAHGALNLIDALEYEIEENF